MQDSVHQHLLPSPSSSGQTTTPGAAATAGLRLSPSALLDAITEISFAPFVSRLPPRTVDELYRELVRGWEVYRPLEEFARMGVPSEGSGWRVSTVNESYRMCPSYPAILVVPASLNDQVRDE
jgi:hypothetical protein